MSINEIIALPVGSSVVITQKYDTWRIEVMEFQASITKVSAYGYQYTVVVDKHVHSDSVLNQLDMYLMRGGDVCVTML